MRRPPGAAVFLVSVAFALFSESAQTANVAADPFDDPQLPASDPISDDNLLLVEVALDQLSLTDAMTAYDAPGGLLIPVGELARLLDVDITVQMGERRIVGTIGEARRPVLVDKDNAIVRVAGSTQLLLAGDMVVGANDIYVRSYLLEKFLPVKVRFDSAGLRLVLTALEPLPIQSRLDRLKRLRGLSPGGGGGADEVYRIRSTPKLFTLPSFDVSLDAGGQSETPHTPYRYDVRAGGDLLFSNFQGYLGSDEKGRPVNARALLERRDASGHALGPLGFTRVSAGDIYTPALPLGPRSQAGRGLSFSTAPLTQQSVFGRIDLRGELPLGYDVELYVNDVLRSGQSTPVQGRYEFRDVPLIRGINIIRIVAYGPRGERSEEVKVVNVGGGQLEKGQFVVDFGAAQQQRSLIEFNSRDSSVITSPGVGDLRLAMNILYGLSETVTLAGGLGSYSPTGLGQRRVATGGIRTSIRGIATQLDVARDDRNGTAYAVGLASEYKGVSGVLRHSEYRGAFVDETTPRGGDGRALERSSEVDLDWQLRPAKLVVPMSVRASRDEYANGDLSWNGLFRASSAIGGVYLSSGLDFERYDPVLGPTSNRMSGSLSASSFALFKWQLRSSLDYQILPRSRVRAASVTADRNLSDSTALRFGLGHSFIGDKETTVQASAIRRLGFADLALDAEYSVPKNDWRIGLQLAFSLVRSPLGGSYTFQRPGAAAGGNMALQAFLDENGNGRFDKTEEPLPGVAMAGAAGEEIQTDEKGRALVTGLGYGSVAQVRTNLDNVALDNVAGPPPVIEFTPRAGTVAVVSYPIQAKGEVMVSIFVRRGEKKVGLSAVMLRVIGDNGDEREALTEYDGSVLFDSLRPGGYRLELVEQQAQRLKMRLEAPVRFTIGASGGAAPDVQGVVVFQ